MESAQSRSAFIGGRNCRLILSPFNTAPKLVMGPESNRCAEQGSTFSAMGGRVPSNAPILSPEPLSSDPAVPRSLAAAD